MTESAGAIASRTPRRAGWAAIASGVMGLLSFGFLIAFIVYVLSQKTEFESLKDVPLTGRLLLYGNYAGILLQALLMIPVAIAVHALVRRRSEVMSRAAVVLGIGALIAIVVLRALLFLDPEQVSDIWFIGPMGFVGIWLIVVNRLLRSVISRGLSVTGTIAGIGLAIAGLSFFALLDLGALMHDPDAYAEDVNFHIGLWIGGFPGLSLYPIWAILLGRSLLRGRRA